MKNIFFIFLFFVLCFADNESIVNSTYILDDANFDQLVQNGNKENWFVMFHAPWCPHCKRLTPIFQEMAKNLTNLVNFGMVDW